MQCGCLNLRCLYRVTYISYTFLIKKNKNNVCVSPNKSCRQQHFAVYSRWRHWSHILVMFLPAKNLQANTWTVSEAMGHHNFFHGKQSQTTDEESLQEFCILYICEQSQYLKLDHSLLYSDWLSTHCYKSSRKKAEKWDVKLIKVIYLMHQKMWIVKHWPFEVHLPKHCIVSSLIHQIHWALVTLLFPAWWKPFFEDRIGYKGIHRKSCWPRTGLQ